MLDYFGDDRVWLQTNLQAARRFESIMFLPGFWPNTACVPSRRRSAQNAFGRKNTFPTAERSLHDLGQIDRLKKPNCRTDGLLPFVIRRLQRCRPEIEAAGHRIRFAVAADR